MCKVLRKLVEKKYNFSTRVCWNRGVGVSISEIKVILPLIQVILSIKIYYYWKFLLFYLLLLLLYFINSGFITFSLNKFGVKLKISGHFGSNQKFGVILGQVSNFTKSRQIIYQNNAFGVSFSKKVVLRSSEVSQGHKSRKKSQISKFNEIIWSFLKWPYYFFWGFNVLNFW